MLTQRLWEIILSLTCTYFFQRMVKIDQPEFVYNDLQFLRLVFVDRCEQIKYVINMTWLILRSSHQNAPPNTNKPEDTSWKKGNIYQTLSIFGFHVSFRACTSILQTTCQPQSSILDVDLCFFQIPGSNFKAGECMSAHSKTAPLQKEECWTLGGE